MESISVHTYINVRDIHVYIIIYIYYYMVHHSINMKRDCMYVQYMYSMCYSSNSWPDEWFKTNNLDLPKEPPPKKTKDFPSSGFPIEKIKHHLQQIQPYQWSRLAGRNGARSLSYWCLSCGGIDTVLNRLEIRSISYIAGIFMIFVDLHDLHPFYSYESELGTPRIGMVDD